MSKLSQLIYTIKFIILTSHDSTIGSINFELYRKLLIVVSVRVWHLVSMDAILF